MRKLLTGLLCSLFLAPAAHAQQYYLFTGTYTTGKSEGIYVYKFDAADGSITPIDTAKGVENPSYLTLSSNGQFLYAVNENGEKKPGFASAFAFDKNTGKLTFLNKVATKGDYPCYISITENGKWVFVANYGGGSLVAIATNKDGSLAENMQPVSHQGKGLNPARQDKPHVHQTVLSPDERYLLVTDLGTDKVHFYGVMKGAKSMPLYAVKPDTYQADAGSGPRHLSFHPNGKWVYLIEELSGMISAFTYQKGGLERFQKTNAHPENYTGARGSADIHVSPDGKFLYASNRFEANNLAIFSIDPANGMLKLVGFQDVIGKKPRNFIIEPDGKYVLVANQDTDNIVVFARDAQTGLLTPTGKTITVGNPSCLQLLPIK
ncbi:lactonase family protein [Flavihumibacter rivuli]|uniref:lactonase family protein n=1 Tax=Flavihumibacter rivuli TaxID=2838156 RepID=UPI001BDEB48E|nr:lactonase family protein [Flavihumibacter rivuli]ULQ57326.1 lactonase family protein [Flavihumibacter rivuli]